MTGVGAFGRLVSRQAAHPSGLLGRMIGRIWVRETAAVNDAVLAALAPQSGETVLEIGHGSGRTLSRILQAGADAVGVEVSEIMSSQARRRNRRAVAEGRLRLIVGDGVSLPLAAGSVDAVVGVHTIYFWQDPQATLTEGARVLRPEGRLVVASRDGALSLPRRFDPAVYSVPTLQELHLWLAEAGFEITAENTFDDVLIVVAARAKDRSSVSHD